MNLTNKIVYFLFELHFFFYNKCLILITDCVKVLTHDGTITGSDLIAGSQFQNDCQYLIDLGPWYQSGQTYVHVMYLYNIYISYFSYIFTTAKSEWGMRFVT